MADIEQVLEGLLATETETGTNTWRWQLAAGGAISVALLALGLSYLLWALRPDVVPLVQLVHVDEANVVRLVGAPMPMERYTVVDWQWVSFLKDWVIHLRWRGIDSVQAAYAHAWMQTHVCGGAVEQYNRYAEHEQPGKQLGSKKRQVSDILVTKTEDPGIYVVTWEEVFVDGPRSPVTSSQTVHVAVARRKVDKETKKYNDFGLCVKSFAGLTL